MFRQIFVRFAVSGGRFVQLYESRIAANLLRPDPKQAKLVSLFQTLGDQLENRSKNEILRGMYIVGGCGTGKTMLMDMFFENLEIEKKKRVHFHEYMIDVHSRMFRLQKKLDKTQTPLIDQVASELMQEATVLCFDEFQVTFIADAVIMRSLFTKMLNAGVVIVATSNRVPDDLYLNGLNRDLFTPFIPVLKKFCHVHNMDSETDYRQARGASFDQVMFSTTELLESAFFQLAQNKVEPAQISVQGRSVYVSRAAQLTRIGWFSFAELCDQPLGSADYIAIAKRFHTVFIDKIPILTLNERDQLRRFISLIDSLYDAKTRIFFSSPALEEIFSKNNNAAAEFDEVFAWDRTLSRLHEMVSQPYLLAHSRKLPISDFYGQFDVFENFLEVIFARYDKNNDGIIAVAGLNRMANELASFLGRNEVQLVSAEILEKLTFEPNRVKLEDFKAWVEKHGLLSLITQP